MLKPLLLILSLFALTAFSAFDQPFKPEVNETNTTAPLNTIDVKFNYIDAPLVDIVWCSEKKNVIFLLSEKSTVYRSVDDGFSGHLMNEHLQMLGKKELGDSKGVGQVSRMIQSPVDSSMLILLGNEGLSWITTDCGATFKVLNQGRRVDDFLFHPSERTWLLASAWTLCEDFGNEEPCRRYKELFVTKDLGEHWETIAGYVFQFSWAKLSNSFYGIPKERIIIAHEPEGQGNQKLSGWSDKLEVAYSDDFFKTTVSLVKGGNKFLVSSDFLFVVHVEKSDTDEVTLLVGDPRNRIYHLRPIELPVKRLLEHSYTILDTNEKSVFLHINHEGEKSRYGSVYVSDSTGVRYNLALQGNIRNPDGQCDFERVQGLEGIYLSNVYDKDALKKLKGLDSTNAFPQQAPGVKKGSEDSAKYSAEASKRSLEDFKKTMISFDKGGMWETLTPPEKDVDGNRITCSSEDECSLHLHSISNTNFGPFYTTENSLGIVLGTGNIGEYLSNKADEINTYLSRDGGLTWYEIANGSHIYEVGDHGSLLLMAPDQHATTEILYSWNEGLTWESLKISDVPIEVQNIIIEPSNTAEKFLIYGRAKDVTKRGAIIAVDFTPLHQKWCTGHNQPDTPESDYETWTPNGKISPHCLMGRQTTYTRRKRESTCFNSEEHEAWRTIKNCECTEEDWECDYGFSRVKNGPCLSVDDKFLTMTTTRTAPEQCYDFYTVSRGYRRIAGDTCEGGVDHEPLRLPCPGMGALNSKNLTVLLALIAIVLGLMWMSNKENSVKAKDFAGGLYKKLWSKLPVKKEGTPLGFRSINDIPDTLRDEDDDFGKIVFEETEEKAEPIEDAHLIEYTQPRKMTEKKGVDAANKPVPTLNRPGDRKMK